MTIDITPEAVDHICTIHEGYGQHGTVATLRALSAALTDYQKGQAYRYIGKDGLPILARDLEDQRDAAIDALTASQAETAAAYEVAIGAVRQADASYEGAPGAYANIRALTPADSKAALDRMIAEAEELGMRKAAGIVWNSDNDVARWERGFLQDRILAAIQKGGE